MAITRTYTVGNIGGVRRLDNLTGPWLDVSVTNSIPSLTGDLFDVETDPTDGDKVFAIGEGRTNEATFGIYVSTNAGASWFIPGGNYQTNFDLAGRLVWNEVWVLDSLNIFVAGNNGYVAKSTDGGLTFNLCTQLPAMPACSTGCTPLIQPVYSVHFVTASIGVVGTPACSVGTIDGGTTWVILNGGNPIVGPSGDIQDIIGIHLSQDLQTIVAMGKGRTHQSLDAGATFTEVYDWDRNGRHLTWINDLELWGFGASQERIKTLDGGATWIVISPSNPGAPTHNAGHFYQNQNGFYSQNADILSTTNGSSSGILSETSPHFIWAVWTWLAPQVCYRLVNCLDPGAYIVVSLDLSGAIGQVVTWCRIIRGQCIPIPGCFIVELSPTCEGALTGTQMQITATFEDCEDCQPICYLLHDCSGEKPDIVVNNNLAQYVGHIIKIEDCGDTCWEVFLAETCDGATAIGTITAVFDDCVTCLPPVLPIPPLELNSRRIKPGYDTPGCPPEYTEKVNCTFGEAMYDMILARRFGIEVCCDIDDQKWTIKKELLDLRSLFDQSLCDNAIKCCPPCQVIVQLLVSNTTGCPGPSAITAEITIPLASCMAPNNVQSAIIIS